MGLFSSFRKKPDSESVSRPPTDNGIQDLRSILNPSLSITELMTNTTVASCVSLIADGIAQLPFNLYQKTKGGRYRATSHPLYSLLKDNPNPEQVSFTFFQQLVAHLLLRGNAYIFTARAQGLNPYVQALYALDPDKMTIKRDWATMEVAYLYRVAGKEYWYNRDQILHIPAFVLSGMYGLSPLEYASHVARTGNDLDEYVSNYFTGELRSRLLIDVPAGKKWSKDNTKEWNEYIRQVYTGKENTGKPLFMYDGLKASPLEIPSNIDAQLDTTLARSEREIAKMYRVPLFMLGKDDAKFANNDQSNAFFLQMTLQPWITRIEKYLAKLIPSYERDYLYFEFETNAMLKGNQQARTEIYVKEITNGISTLNDINRRENRPLLEPEIGDVRFIPVNLMPLTAENVGAYMAAQKEKMEQIGKGKVTIKGDMTKDPSEGSE